LRQRANVTLHAAHLNTARVATFRPRSSIGIDISEILMNVVLNIFTNETNHIAATEIDFPVVLLKKAA